jgi:serine/threonine protein kinase
MSALMLGVGETVAGYRIDGVIGSGGMGVVYEATQLSLNRTVALKVLAPHLSDDLVFRERFRREGMMQAAIEHQHVVAIYEAGESEAGLYLAMRLVRGSNLKDLVATGSLEPERALTLLGQVADALDAAHRHGVVHRDIKPQNILVEDGNGFLADFGLTKASGQNTVTRTGSYIGTLDYVPPEQIRGETLTAASDLYAFGAVLYECLTGVVPYTRDSEAALLYAHLSDSARPMSELRPGLPSALDAVVEKAMAKEPDARYRTAAAIVHAAQEALGTGAVEPQPARPPRADTFSSRSKTVIDATPRLAPPPVPDLTTKAPFPWPLVAVAALLVAVAGAAAFTLADSAKTRPPVLQTAAASGVRVSYPSDWVRSDVAPSFSGVPLSRPLVIRARDSSPAMTLIAGIAPATVESALRAVATSRPGVVKLAAGNAYRYANVRSKGSAYRATVFALPTTSGTALVACLAAAGVDKTACEAIAATMRTTSSTVAPLGPSRAYAAALGATLGRLDSARSHDRGALAQAKTRAAQGRAAGALRADYRSASTAVARLAAPAGLAASQALLATSLEQGAAAYAALARATTAGAAGRYAQARRRVISAEHAVSKTLAAFRAAGYVTRTG